MMFENVLNNSIFGKVAPGMCRLTVNGQVAVRTSDGNYKSYDVETGRLTNQSKFVFDIGEDFFFVIPTNKVKKGDIILVNGKPNCVISADKNKIEAVNFENGTLDTIIPERHVFMGNTYFYGKIVSLFGSKFKSKSGSNNMFKTMLQMQFMQSMMGLKSTDANSSNGGMMQTMMMMSMMNGGGMGDLFGDMFDFDDDDTEDDKNNDEEDK